MVDLWVFSSKNDSNRVSHSRNI